MHLKFALRYFKAKKSANAINIIAWVTITVIAFATCCQVLVLSVFNGFEGLVKSLYSVFYSDMKVIPAKGKTFFLTPEQIGELKKLPFVAGLAPVAEERALLQNGEAQTVVTLKGVDSGYGRISGIPSHISSGIFYTGNIDSPRLVVGYGVQNRIGVNVDAALPASNVTVILPKKTNTADVSEAMSEGIAGASGVFAVQQEIDNQYALTDIEFVRSQMGFRENEYSATEIKLKTGSDDEAAKKALQAALGPAYMIQTRYEQNSNLYSTMRTEKWAIYAVLTLILIIAAFNMVSALTMLVLEKRKDISVLKSMGTTTAGIQKIFLSEGLLLGVIGAAAGILLALIICFLQIKFHLVRIQGGSFLVDYFPVKLLPGDLMMVAATAVFISFFAAWFPAVKASRGAISLK
ncbi:MAG: FtsX-like permease family protein [Ferruginibacter sp.]